MKATIKVMVGRNVLMTGDLWPVNPALAKAPKGGVAEEHILDSFSEAVFQIEKRINADGAYRCHTEVIVDE